jgi:hypothetical protein
MTPRFTAAIALLLVASCAAPQVRRDVPQRWNPASAADDARRDLSVGNIRFAYVGGYVPIPPGVPRDFETSKVLHHYGMLEVGPQGCSQDQYYGEREEYAQRYNHVMWGYVSNHR